MEKLMSLLERGIAKMGFCLECGGMFYFIPNFKNTHHCPHCGGEDLNFNEGRGQNE